MTPPPIPESELSPEARLRAEIAGLGVDEILSLCFAFNRNLGRVRLYLDVLRGRGGQRAQFACCLICFDLARQGDEAAQTEFAYLTDTVRELGANSVMVDALVGDDPYLGFIWELLEAQLEEIDTRFDADQGVTTAAPDGEEIASFDLITDDDFELEDDLNLLIDDTAMRQQFHAAVQTFLGAVDNMPMYNPTAGYRLRTRKDTARTEEFLLALDSFRDVVPEARGYRALTLLFYGVHQRSKTLFGGINDRKQRLLRDGLTEFASSGQEMIHIVGVLGPMHSGAAVWMKIGELLADFVIWQDSLAPGESQSAESYDVIGRIMERDALESKKGAQRRGRR